MQNRLLIALCLLGCGLLASCSKKEESVAPYGSIHFNVSNEVSGKAVTMGPISYKNFSGNQYSVDLLKYILSNFTLIKADGSEVHYNNYELIDASDPDYLHIDLDSIPNGTYKSIRFYVGVDSSRNHSGLQEGALDPVHGMIWTWNTGYIFFKHEGNYLDTAGATKTLSYHLGTDASLVTVNIPLSDLQISGDKKNLVLHFDLNKIYGSSGGPINFNQGAIRHSDPRQDGFWMATMRINFPSAFTIGN